MTRFLLAALLLLPLSAQADGLVRSITVYGQAEDEVKPDAALVTVTIENKSPSLDETKRLQDKEQEALLAIIKKMDIDGDDVKTQHASLNPRYEYNHQLKKNEFKGYQASTNLQVKLRDLEKVGVLLDRLVKGGFERVNNVQYILDDDIKHNDAVLVKALANAKVKAAKLAKELGEDLGKAISLQEGVSRTPVQPMPMMRSMAMAEGMAMSAPAPSAPPSGLIQISGTITATFEIK